MSSIEKVRIIVAGDSGKLQNPYEMKSKYLVNPVETKFKDCNPKLNSCVLEMIYEI